jgi:hypothetical protein
LEAVSRSRGGKAAGVSLQGGEAVVAAGQFSDFMVDREFDLEGKRGQVGRRGADETAQGAKEGEVEGIVAILVGLVRGGVYDGLCAAKCCYSAVPFSDRAGSFVVLDPRFVTPDSIRGPSALRRERREDGSRIEPGVTLRRARGRRDKPFGCAQDRYGARSA